VSKFCLLSRLVIGQRRYDPEQALRFFTVFAALFALLGTTAVLGQSSTEGRWSRDDVWDAVGRLDFEGSGFCTGALIAPDLVLTAAHCLFEKDTGDLIAPEKMQFLAGWRDGRASAHRNVRRVALHPEYNYLNELDEGAVRFDFALVELAHPIRNGRIEPFLTSDKSLSGRKVGVVSYARDHSERPALQEVCDVIAQKEEVVVTSCQVDFGASGAPIFMFEGGRANIVSVVSAKAELGGQNVSLGTTLGEHLDLLRDALANENPLINGKVDRIRRVRSQDAQSTSDAKFVRP
jgi:V8-like Glu-specific endopeptidase